MGFFSQNCNECGHPLLSTMACDAGVNEWMNDAVVISSSGDINTGSYDGYGNVGNADSVVGFGDATVYHRACWELADEPTEYRGRSDDADDQGWFFDDEHAKTDPRLDRAVTQRG